MKKAILVLVAVALIGLFAVPASWAGPAEETLQQWAERGQQQGVLPQMYPQANLGFYYDLLSNANKWASFLVVTNWSLNTRIEFDTAFVPTGGTPQNIQYAVNYIDPNAVAYLGENQLNWLNFGRTNWFGIGMAVNPPAYVSSGVLLYSSEFGLTWIPGDGPYSF